MKSHEDLSVYVSPEPNSGCHLWTGPITRLGYGMTFFRGKMRSTHRIAWILYRGDIPDGQDVCHRCDTPLCVNPDHLFLGTHSDNMRDMVEKGRALRRANHCPSGHPYDAANSYIRSGGRYRDCVECSRKRSREYQRRKHGRANHKTAT